MPLILDAAATVPMDVGDMEVDALFGDGVELGLPSDLRPPSKALLQRVDELRRTGCCRGIAWSPSGTLATIGHDARSVQLRFLRSHPDTGQWALSDPTDYSPWDLLPQVSSIVHLAWSAAGSPELAVVDSFGRVHIASFNSAANRPMLLRRWDSDPLDDMHSIVGSYAMMPPMHNKQKIAVSYGPAQRKDSGTVYPVTYVPHMGPNHFFPGKSAFVFVTTNGTLKILWPQLNNRYEEKTLELESITSSDDSITHASICSDRGTLLIALTTAAKQLCVVRVNVTWVPSGQADKPHASAQPQLKLEEKRVAVTDWLQIGSTVSSQDVHMAQISHLEIVPSVCENVHNNKWAPPLVYVVHSHVPSIGAAYAHETGTMVDRWEVCVEQPQSLHTAFSQLAAKHGATDPPMPPSSRLRRLESVPFANKILLEMLIAQQGKIAILVFSDGSIQFRDTASFDELYREPVGDSVSCLNELGFSFSDEMPCLQAAFSPTRLSFAQICEDGKVKWNLLRLPDGEMGSSMDDAKYANIATALALTISNSTLLSQCFDDALAVARRYAEKNSFPRDLSMEIIKCLRVGIDYAEESHHDKLLSNGHIVVCCSVMAHLDFHGYFRARTFTNKLANLTLHTKSIILTITMASNAYTQQNATQRGVTPLDDPYIVDVLAGCGEWIRDLIAWIVDGLFCLLDDGHFMGLLQQESSMPQLAQYLVERSDVTLHLCLCSVTRVLLGAACRRLEYLYTVSTRAMTHFEKPSYSRADTRVSSALSAAYRRMHTALSESLVKWTDMEKLLSTLTGEIQSMYKTELAHLQKPPAGQGGGQQNPGEEVVKKARAHSEQLLLLGMAPPAYFQPVVAKFFQTHLQHFRHGTNQSGLFFADYSLVEFPADEKLTASSGRKAVFVDTFRRNRIVRPATPERKKQAVQAGIAAAGSEIDNVPGQVSSQNQSQSQGRQQQQQQQQQQHHNHHQEQWRRCSRCGSVMVDVQISRQNIQYMLSQLKKCACGGNWGVLPADSLVC